MLTHVIPKGGEAAFRKYILVHTHDLQYLTRAVRTNTRSLQEGPALPPMPGLLQPQSGGHPPGPIVIILPAPCLMTHLLLLPLCCDHCGCCLEGLHLVHVQAGGDLLDLGLGHHLGIGGVGGHALGMQAHTGGWWFLNAEPQGSHHWDPANIPEMYISHSAAATGFASLGV